MSPVEKEIVRRKLSIIIENLKGLEPIKEMTEEEYIGDFYKRKATERLLQELIEAATDINTHIIVETDNSVPDDYYETFIKLGIDRGLRIDQGFLVIVDGSKGLIKAVKNVFEGFALIHRCQWHKRENVVSYMSKSDQLWLRKRLQHAYERPTYDEAKRELTKIHAELADRNQSAATSLEEGLEETLTLHRLGLFGVLGKSLKTTNCMESILSQVEWRCRKVGRWHNSSQRQRWMASALLDIEPDLNRIKGWRHLSKLRDAIQRELGLRQQMKLAA